MICNRVIDQAGAGLLVCDRGVGSSLVSSKRSAPIITFDLILEGDRWRKAVYALDGKTPTSRQYKLLLQLEDSLSFLTRWALDNGRRFSPEPNLVGEWRTLLRQYLDHLVESLSAAERPRFEERLAELAALGFAVHEAQRLAFLDRLRDFPILVDLSRRSREALRPTAKLTDAITELLGVRRIVALLTEVKARDRWECRLQMTLEDRLRSGVARLSWMMLRTGLREPAAFFRHYGMQQRLASVSAPTPRVPRNGAGYLDAFRRPRRRTGCPDRRLRRCRGRRQRGSRLGKMRSTGLSPEKTTWLRTPR